jgi:hypothetical protein
VNTEYQLSPGDVLYIPRGFVHETRALDSTSVHLTLTVSVLRWLTLWQRALLVQARTDGRLRRAIPVAVLREGMTESPLAYVEPLELGHPDASAVATALVELREELLAPKPRLADPSVAVIGRLPVEVGPDSVVRVAPDQLYSLTSAGDGFLLQCIGASIDISSDLQPTISYLCNGLPSSVAALPGELTVEEKVDLARALVSCGFLEVETSWGVGGVPG